MSTIRTKQVESELIHHLTQIILKNIELDDSFITITNAKITPDLRMVKIFISVMPDNKRGSTLEKLNKKSNFLQKELKSKIRFYTIPKLQFLIDEGEIKRIRVSEALLENNK
jgi:ribosome-binding factor A